MRGRAAVDRGRAARREVVATDWYEPALAFTRANAVASGARLETLLVDWNAPPGDLVAAASPGIS